MPVDPMQKGRQNPVRALFTEMPGSDQECKIKKGGIIDRSKFVADIQGNSASGWREVGEKSDRFGGSGGQVGGEVQWGCE